MPNDFSADGNCKAVWNLESGALIVDSKGGNTLANNGVDEDNLDFKQGSCSGGFVRSNGDYLYITNVNLDSGFPLKNGEGNKTFSISFWFKCTGTISNNAYLVSMPSANLRSFLIELLSSKITLKLSSDGVNWDNIAQHGTALVANRWYHVVVTYNAADDSVRIRIWDDTAGAIVGVDHTSTEGDIYVGTGPFYIGYSFSFYALEGNMDEVVVFDDVLNVAEIDEIRAGAYGPVGPPPAESKFGSLISNEPIEQKTGVFTEV